MPTRLSYVAESVDPVTAAEAKLAARMDADMPDDLVTGLIGTAREQAEHLTGRTFRPQVLREELADWPADTDAIAVHAATAVEVRYWNGTGWSLLAGAAYEFAPGGIGGNGTVLAPVIGTSWPTLADRAVGPRVRIDITAGPASPAGVPERVKQFIKASVASWIATPEAQRVSQQLTPNPLFERLLDGEKLFG